MDRFNALYRRIMREQSNDYTISTEEYEMPGNVTMTIGTYSDNQDFMLKNLENKKGYEVSPQYDDFPHMYPDESRDEFFELMYEYLSKVDDWDFEGYEPEKMDKVFNLLNELKEKLEKLSKN